MCRQSLAVLILLIFVARPADAQNGGIELFSGETIFEGGTRLSLSHVAIDKRAVYRGSDRIHINQHRRKTEHQFIAGVDYGVHREVTLTALIPYIYKTIHSHSNGRSQTSYSSGLGDVALAVKYRPVRILWHRSAFNIAGLVGVELPTGRVNKEERGRNISPDEQPGSGSFDPLAALLTTLSINRFRMDTQLRYKWNTEGSRDYDRGDVFISQLALKYRFLHKKYPGPSASVSASFRYRYESNSRQNSRSVNNEGSDVFSILIGFGSHILPELDFGMTVNVPIYQRYRGTQLGLDTHVITQFGYRF
jgi:hypothetical protein